MVMRGLFRGAWMSVLFIHYEAEPDRLQAEVPFRLDVRDGGAYVSVVAFTQEQLRFAFGGRMTDWVGQWFANHEFLNVRTYVRHRGEPGIFFLAEWVPRRVVAWIAPPMFGLPYRLGEIKYEHAESMMSGWVTGKGSRFRCRAARDDAKHPRPCERRTRDEFLLERYVAFTEWHGWLRVFRVEHAPWPQTRVDVTVEDESLLHARFNWWPTARLAGANFSPGVNAVTIDRPRRVTIRRRDD